MKRNLIIAAAILLLVGCKENEDKQAGKVLASAESAYSAGQYQEAKNLIDSIRTAYPKAFETRKAGIVLMQKVELAEMERTIAFQDSLIAQCKEQIEACRSRFVFEKDEQYQDLGVYSVASQALEKNIGRNYLKATVDEKGRLNLVSNWSGSAYIHHRQVRLSVGDNYVDTPVSDDVYEFKDLGVCYEKCNFTDGKDGGASAFIAMNSDSKISVTLKGEKQTVKSEVSAADRQAIKDVYSLSLLLKSKEEAEQTKDEAQRRIQFIKSKQTDASAE